MLAWLAAASACTVVPAHAGPFSGLEALFKHWGLFQGLQISGNNTLTFQKNIVQGSSSAFEGQRWDTNPFMDQSSISLEGPIWKEFAFKSRLSDSATALLQPLDSGLHRARHGAVLRRPEHRPVRQPVLRRSPSR